MFNWYCFIYLGCDLCYAIICLTGIVLSIQVVIYAMLLYDCFIYPGCDLCYAILCLTGIVLSI